MVKRPVDQTQKGTLYGVGVHVQSGHSGGGGDRKVGVELTRALAFTPHNHIYIYILMSFTAAGFRPLPSQVYIYNIYIYPFCFIFMFVLLIRNLHETTISSLRIIPICLKGQMSSAPHVCFSRGVGPVEFWMLEPVSWLPKLHVCQHWLLPELWCPMEAKFQ